MQAFQKRRSASNPSPVGRQKFRGSRRSNRGIALIEVLVALLIFMLGVLGLIGMQSSLTQTQTESKLRADAAFLANELVGRMWADSSNLTAYAGEDGCSASSCTEWRAKLTQLLPGSGAEVTVDGLSGDISITVTWKVPNGGAHKYVTQTVIKGKAAS